MRTWPFRRPSRVHPNVDAACPARACFRVSSRAWLRSFHLAGRGESGLENAGISAASADVAGARFLHVVQRGVRIPLKERAASDYETRRAESAHERVLLYKRRLYRAH